LFPTPFKVYIILFCTNNFCLPKYKPQLFYKQTIGIFSQFFEHSDVLEAVSECVSTSLADKTSIGGAEKQENDRVCFGITVAVFGKAMFV